MSRYVFDYSSAHPIVRFVVGLIVVGVSIAIFALLLPFILGFALVVFALIAGLWAWYWYKTKNLKDKYGFTDVEADATSNDGNCVFREIRIVSPEEAEAEARAANNPHQVRGSRDDIEDIEVIDGPQEKPKE